MKKIAFITTARSEYNASRWVIKAIHDDPELELKILAGGTHYSPIHGYSCEEIYKNYDYNTVIQCVHAEIDWNISFDNITQLSETINWFFEINKPDLCIINGDRIELMPIVVLASIHGIPIAHIGGGDITDGSIDNETRYAISRYAHLHFVSDDTAAKNLIKSGEESWRVCVTGQCGLENIIRTEKLSLEETSKAIGLDLSTPTAVCIYYPSRELNISIREQIDCILDALHNAEQQTVFIYPCSEIGSNIIIQNIDEYCKTHDNCKVFANLENQLFQSLLWYSCFMIGNSSSGVIEVPFLNKWTINIGNRQQGRYMQYNVLNCDYNKEQIIDTIEWCTDNFRDSLYSNDIEFPSKRIIQAIKENIDKPELLHKRILL